MYIVLRFMISGSAVCVSASVPLAESAETLASVIDKYLSFGMMLISIDCSPVPVHVMSRPGSVLPL